MTKSFKDMTKEEKELIRKLAQLTGRAEHAYKFGKSGEYNAIVAERDRIYHECVARNLCR